LQLNSCKTYQKPIISTIKPIFAPPTTQNVASTSIFLINLKFPSLFPSFLLFPSFFFSASLVRTFRRPALSFFPNATMSDDLTKVKARIEATEAEIEAVKKLLRLDDDERLNHIIGLDKTAVERIFFGKSRQELNTSLDKLQEDKRQLQEKELILMRNSAQIQAGTRPQTSVEAQGKQICVGMLFLQWFMQIFLIHLLRLLIIWVSIWAV
jgi:hypothetical protein